MTVRPLALCLFALAGPAAAADRPNVLLAVADDWGHPHAGAYGDPAVKTPTFDRVAREGAVFAHAFCSSPSCTPSRGALLTGQFHWRLEEGANLWGTLPAKFPAYPGLLKRAGYAVGHSRKAWGPGRLEPGGRGEDPAGPRFPNLAAFLEARPKGQPFCFWWGSSDPHRPYDPGTGAGSGIDPATVRVPAALPDRPAVRADVADYLFEVQRFDRELGEALALLEQAGELDDTLVVVTSDHGMPFPRGKSNLYDLGTRVPLAVRWPKGVKPGRTVADFVSLTDLAPTFLAAAGLTPPAEMTGRSLLPVLAGDTPHPARDAVVFGKERHVPAQEAGNLGGYPGRAIRTADFLFVRNYAPDRWPNGVPESAAAQIGNRFADCDDGPTKTFLVENAADPAVKRFYDLAFAKRPAEELYDLRADPDQLVNVAAAPEHAAAKAALAARLDAALRATADPRAGGGDAPFDRYPYYGGKLKPKAAKPVAKPPADESAAVLATFKGKCLACHGGDPKGAAPKGGFDLRSRTAMLKGGDGGPAVVPGDPDNSPLVAAVARHGDVSAMPPKENDALTADEVARVRRWVAAGAEWPTAAAAAGGPADGVTVATSGGLSPDWTNRRYDPADLWAYQPLKRPPVPAAGHPVDAFVGAKLVAAKLTPAPPADRRTLLRRVTFDLLGLPPTPEQTDAFLADPAPDDAAYRTVIDRLLASPHYGEKWGRHWLDVVRYADSSGGANDYERGNAWRYRDYVVRSFNSDKPYDRFVREQLAGDETNPSDPEGLVAIGFLRAGAWELTGMEVPKVARARFLDDVTDAVGQTFLAHPLQCCRCHDHKFDPVPTRDYYRVQAAFATTQPAERPAVFLPTESVAGFEEKKHLAARRERYAAELERLQRVEAAGRTKWLAANPDKTGQKPPRHEYLSPADLGLERIARKGLERLKWEAERYEPVALSVYSGRTPAVKAILAPFRPPADRLSAGELERTCVLTGGDAFSPAEPVTPGVLSAVPASTTVPDAVTGRRAAFAAWVTDPANPLTPRVMANRVWAWHFGRGIAGSPNNFGATGKRPTHPELLDFLAAEFVAHGWSVKHLHRLILTSAAYRRSAAHPDPAAAAAYAAFTPRRLTAEELRDATLAVSGELNPAVGGLPVRPELHPEVALQPRQVMGTFAPAWVPSPRPEQRHRRSIYALQLRGLRDPFAEVFNQPSPETSCDLRDGSTVTPQVFALFNSPRSFDRALALAARATKETSSREAAVERMVRLAYGRPPTPAERTACLAHWAAMTRRHEGLTFAPPANPTRVTREAVEENTGERFAFEEHLDAAADFVPDLQPHAAGPGLRGLAEVGLVLLNSNEFVSVE